MGKVAFDFLTIKAAGVYTQEIDNSTRSVIQTNALRLIPGFSNKGPFNRPVWLETDADRLMIFGDIDTKLEHKGCFFNRFLRTSLQEGPVIALNLLNTDDSYNGPDQVNYASLSLDAATPNPDVKPGKKYGQYDYSADGIDKLLYGTESGDMVPFIGQTPFSSLFNRSRFWIPDKDMLTAVAARGLGSPDYTDGGGSYEYTNFLNFGNVGTEEFSILVLIPDPDDVKAYRITAETWYGGVENIPFGWIRPSDYISDYFIQVVCVKGNWSNYPVLSTDPVWKSYFNKNGIIRSKINNFMNAEGVVMLGSWTGCIIPDFVNRQGENLSIERKINARTEVTGLLMSFNEDAAHVVSGDYTGIDASENDDNFQNDGKFTWGIDIDGDREITSKDGEGYAQYIVDMVGHGVFADRGDDKDSPAVPYEYVHSSYDYEDIDVDGNKNVHTIIPGEVLGTEDLVLLMTDKKSYTARIKKTETVPGVDGGPNTTRDIVYPAESEHNTHGFATGVYLPKDFFKIPESMKAETLEAAESLKKTNKAISEALFKDFVANRAYYILTEKEETKENDVVEKWGEITKKTDIIKSTTKVIYFDIDEDGNPVTSTARINTEDPEAIHTMKMSFVINDVRYYAYFLYKLFNDGGIYKPYAMCPGTLDTSVAAAAMNVSVDMLTADEVSALADYIEDNPTTGMPEVKTTLAGEPHSDVYELEYITRPCDAQEGDLSDTGDIRKIGFLSYVFAENPNEVDPDKKAILPVTSARYFCNTEDDTIWSDAAPVTEVTKNMFIVTDDEQWDYIKVGSFVRNITFYNKPGEANRYKVIPGITRVIEKRFVPVDANGYASYLGKQYQTNFQQGELGTSRQGAKGFYLFTTIDPVLIENGVDEDGNNQTYIMRQLPISDPVISGTLRFIPLRGLKLTSRHRPGYDLDGNISIEGGISKIYSVLHEAGVHRGLCNPAMVDYRYIVDTMSYGLEGGLGGKSYLSKLAQDRNSTLAVLNLPSAKQFAVSSNPYFCKSYTPGVETRPSFDTKYVAEGGNHEMGSSKIFSLPNEDDGSKYAAAFFPNLIYSEGGRRISVPPAADVCNVLVSKFTGLNNPYAINANLNGIIKNRYVVDLEFDADTDDRSYLEPFGVNTIIRENGRIIIYGNQTCYQTTKSDMNKLHVRECLNTIEIECNAVLKQFNFQYNTASTRASIVQILTPILSVMQTSGAIDAFTITCDESNNTPEIIEEDFGIVDIGVWFNHGMEKILTRITVNRYGTQNSAE